MEAPRVEVHAEFVLGASARAARDPLVQFVTNEMLKLVLHPHDHRRGISFMPQRAPRLREKTLAFYSSSIITTAAIHELPLGRPVVQAPGLRGRPDLPPDDQARVR